MACTRLLAPGRADYDALWPCSDSPSNVSHATDRARTTAPRKFLLTPQGTLTVVRTDRGEIVEMPLLENGREFYHCFLSHQWTFAQDACRVIKSRLLELVPGIRVFLGDAARASCPPHTCKREPPEPPSRGLLVGDEPPFRCRDRRR